MKSMWVLLSILLFVGGASTGQAAAVVDTPKPNLEGRIVYGAGVVGLSLSEIQEEDVEIVDGVVRVGRFAEHEIRPAAIVSYLLSKQGSGLGFGPMLILDLEIGKETSIGVGNIGAGFMMSFRGNERSTGPITSFGVGVAYVVDTGGKRLREDFVNGQVAPGAEAQFVEFTRDSIALVVTVAFGKKEKTVLTR